MQAILSKCHCQWQIRIFAEQWSQQTKCLLVYSGWWATQFLLSQTKFTSKINSTGNLLWKWRISWSFLHQWQFQFKYICSAYNDEIIPLLIDMCANQFDFGNNSFQWLWWIQDGGPAYWLCEFKNVPLECFQIRLISLNNGVKWPRPSPDLTPRNFFYLGIFKE